MTKESLRMHQPVYGAVPTDKDDRGIEHPYDRAWCWSRLLLSWVSPLLSLGNQKTLEADDVWTLRQPFRVQVLNTSFSKAYAARNESVLRAFVDIFGLRSALNGAGFCFITLSYLLGPVVLNHVVSSLTATDYSAKNVFGWIFLLFITQVVVALVDAAGTRDMQGIAIQFSASLQSMLYRKSLRLNAESRKEKSVSHLTNMCTADTEALYRAAMMIHDLWIIPLQIVITSYMLYNLLGVAAFAGIGVIVFMLFINNLVSKRMLKYMRIYRSSKDVRLKRVTEVFKAISIVKFNAQEDKFAEGIDEARKIELGHLLQARLMTSLSLFLMWGMPVFISVAAFGTFAILLDQELTPAIVFTSIALFQIIQQPLRMITSLLLQTIQAKVALDKIQSFLKMPEMDESSVVGIHDPIATKYMSSNVIVAVENGIFGWDQASTVLKNVNFQVKAGAFFVIHGRVGSGKSSLCSALLGEMVKHNGTVYVGGDVAYCSQQPWIQNMTVRDNILFGNPYDRKKYEKVLNACALTSDLQSLPAGDNTEIGERGVNVSGGQKARIALARACYSDASIFILDSPLSAVDAIVQNEILQKCLLGLLRNKTVILVTHNAEIIDSPHISHAVTINDQGYVVETREHQDEKPTTEPPLLSPLPTTPYVKPLYVDLSQQEDGEPVTEYDLPNEVADEMVLLSPAVSSPYPMNKKNSMTEMEREVNNGVLIKDEERAEGRVSGHVYSAYYHAVGGFVVVGGIILVQSIWQALQISSDFWLSSWSSDSLQDAEHVSTSYRLGVYSALGVLAAVMVLVRTLLVTWFGLKAGKYMFDAMTASLLHAPMRFYDSNPIGRILTRYAGDIASVDVNLSFTFGTFATQVFSTLCSLITAAIVIQWRGIMLLPIAMFYIYIGVYYITPAREIQRLFKTTNAPVLNHLSESIEGCSVIRAYGKKQLDRFKQTSNERMDANNQIWYAMSAVNNWFSLRIQFVSALILLCVTSSLVLLRDVLDVAIIGLAFSYALKVSGNLESIIRNMTWIETLMVSPERLQEYIDIPQEPAHYIPSTDPSSSSKWPSKGAIQFDKVCFRYKEGDELVLKSLSLEVGEGEKIGIVGRTGAGKSSLTMALFRINELASGRILIDGIDTSKIGLKALRQGMSIIPQNPVLFKGTLRNYLDPFTECSDDALWDVLRRVGLSERISEDKSKLESPVEENGENFSVGERQMLCMARALLRESNIVIFDEATAAIDHETDQRLQRVIRSAFSTSTVLTIAHRLDTILDSSRILVLDKGEVVEFDTPRALTLKGSGHFYDLMQEGGYIDKVLEQETSKAKE